MPDRTRAAGCPPQTSSWRKTLAATPALDGLRGLAVVAVMAFHFPTRRWVPGGYLGVDVFLALSGFLLTALLAGEAGRTGTIAVRAFWNRRVRRLAPALFTMLAVYVAADAVYGSRPWFGADPFGPRNAMPVPLSLAARGAGIAALQLFDWARAGGWPLPPLGHLWSLSLEGQFCLVWPVAMVLLVRLRPKVAAAATAGLAALSATLPLFLWNGGQGADRIYFAPDTRVQGLLWGCAAGLLWTSGLLEGVSRRTKAVVATAAAGIVGTLMLTVAEGPVKFLIAFPVVALCASAIVCYLVDAAAGGLGVRSLSQRSLVWLGRRSYAIYLWHFPIASWTHRFTDAVAVPLAAVLSLAAAEASWRLVEQRWVRRRQRPTRAPAAYGQYAHHRPGQPVAPPRPVPVPSLRA